MSDMASWPPSGSGGRGAGEGGAKLSSAPPQPTGWAQVKFRATNSIDDSIEKNPFRPLLPEVSSFGLDISILLKTVKRALTHDSQVVPRRSPALLPKQNIEHWAEDLTAHLEHPRPS